MLVFKIKTVYYLNLSLYIFFAGIQLIPVLKQQSNVFNKLKDHNVSLYLSWLPYLCR